MAVNKVIINNDTVVDLTDTTAEADTVLNGEVFYTASGARATGNLVIQDFVAKDITIAYTVNGTSTINGNLITEATNNAPSGYVPFGVIGVRTNHISVIPVSWCVTAGGNYSYILRNVSTNAVTANLVVTVLYIKS